MSIPIECTKHSTSSDTVAPAVGNMLGCSSPSSLRTMLKSVLFMSAYFIFSDSGGTLAAAEIFDIVLAPYGQGLMKSLRLTGLALSILSFTPAYTFSQNLGTELIHVG